MSQTNSPAVARATGPESESEAATRPRLFRDISFWGMTITQFFGAFNDNLFKQLMLLLAVPVVAGSVAMNEKDQQGLATVIFSLPFVLFSGFAGYLSDRFSKRTVIVLSKVGEIVVMSLGLCAFLAYRYIGYPGLLCVLLLMGLQSTFFGPGKYGILPELIRDRDLPRANGVFLMTTFLAIIFGTALAGNLSDYFMGSAGTDGARHLWKGSLVCVGIACVGTLTSLLVRKVPPSTPGLPLSWSALTITREARETLWSDHPLLKALAASCVFWLASGLAIQTVNSVGLTQLELNKSQTSYLVAMIGIGIAVGAVLAGKLSRGRANPRLVRGGAWGMVLVLLPLAWTHDGGQHVLGYYGSLAALGMLGAAAGMFAIPLQVFLQSRPPADRKGRILAVMNQANFLAILLSGVLYDLFDRLLNQRAWPRSFAFVLMAALILPMALLYHPKFENNSRP